jgi:hypothetical protein
MPALTMVAAIASVGADWAQFRGPGGLGVSNETGLPVKWSTKENIVWRTKLPGLGSSCPVTVGDRVFVTCYYGYGLDAKEPGKMEDLKRHLVCVDRASGKVLWTKEFEPLLPEHKYAGEGSYHGYSSSTPVIDGERLYVFFGKSGVYCFDLDGKQLWHESVGTKMHGSWGSGASPLLYKNLLIVNASIESGALVALDKLTGKEVWRAPGVSSAWNTPMLVTPPPQPPLAKGGTGGVELVVSISGRVRSFNPDTGKELWNADGVHRYVCPSVVAHEGVVYAVGGGHTSLAVRTGGKGDVTKSHGLWRLDKGSNISSPIYHEGHLYWVNNAGGTIVCQHAATGKIVYQERLVPDTGTIYASPVLVEGKLYFVSQKNGVFVVAARPKFEQLAHNVIADDKSRANASLAVSNGRFLMRTDQYLYCIGSR